MSGQPPNVSVVIPAHNRAASIRKAMESVLRQTYCNLELLIVDDASSDDTVRQAASIADGRIRIIENPKNLGAAGARNAGTAQCRGQWVAFQDSDDEWLPDKLEKQMARLEADGTSYVAAYCGLLTLGGLDDQPGVRLALRYTPNVSVTPVDGILLPSLLRTNLISTQTLIVRREVIENLGGFDADTTPIEDWEFAIRLCQQGPIAFVDEPLVLQRFSANSITRNTARWLQSHIGVLAKHSEAFARYPDVLARHYYILAGGFRRQGDFVRAGHYLALARKTDPRNSKVWAQSLYVTALGLISGRNQPQA